MHFKVRRQEIAKEQQFISQYFQSFGVYHRQVSILAVVIVNRASSIILQTRKKQVRQPC